MSGEGGAAPAGEGAGNRARGTAMVPRPAATVALLRPGPRGPEVLLTHRPSTMDFGPGLHVFPGGAVDPDDGDPRLAARSALSPDALAAGWAGDLSPATAAAAAVAAIRELYEEAGVLLADAPGGGPPDAAALAAARAAGTGFADLVERLGLVLRTDLLVPLSRWVTPPVGVSRRYDARFFVASLPDGAAVVADAGEVVAHDWMTPHDALAAMADGRIELWPPTSTSLVQLAPARGIEDVRRHLTPVAPVVAPVVDDLGPDLVRVRLTGAGGIPGNDVCAYLVGRERLVAVDPGQPDDVAAEAILGVAAARGGRIEAVLLTSPAPDHAAGSTSVALVADVPVLAASGAEAVLGGPVRTLRDGDLPDVSDAPIRVHATPGPHPDHLAFELPDADAVLVGDLVGGPGRWIPEPPDEMVLARSLARVRGLGRVRWLPAHGRELPR